MSIDTNYKIVRGIGVPAFKLYYHPKIINAEFIPKEGPILLCGNHLHVLNQLPVICATKRVTHWMAKKEYFDGKLGPFFKSTGAICVDRYGDANKSKEEAINYLKKGSAVGIFPEGTRNIYQLSKIKVEKINVEINNLNKLYQEGKIKEDEYKKLLCELKKALEERKEKLDEAIKSIEKRGIQVIENDIVLPFKFGAVSMAQKTDALIVPFAVTGKYKFNSKDLMVRFGKPFKVGNDLEESNCELRDKVITLVKENLKKRLQFRLKHVKN